MKEKCVDYSQFWSPAFDDMEDFVCFIDRDYNLVEANESFFKVFGDGKKLVGKKCFEIFHSLKKPFPGCPHGKMLETKVSEKGKFYEPSLKKYLSITITPIWGDDHKLIGSIHIAEDVTQLKEEGEILKIRNDFIDKSMTPLAVGDPQGNLLYVNSSCLRLWGYTSSKEVVGRPIVEFWKDKEKIAEIAEAYKNKKSWTGELVAQKKDGTTFDCHIVANVVEDNLGHRLYLISSFTDITERNRMAKALGESEEKYRTLVECSQEGIGFVDPDENITFVNQAFAEMLGFKVDDLIGKNLKELTNAEEFEKYRRETGKRKHGEKSRYETIMYHRDGSPRFLSVSAAPLVDHNGNFGGTIGVVADVTGIKRAEEALKKSELMCHAVLDQTFQFIGVLTPDGKLVRANSTALKFVGVAESDVLGKPLWETPWWKHSREMQDKLRAAVKAASKGQFVRFEASHPAADGGLHYVDFSLKPVKDEKGNVEFLIPEGRDITELKCDQDEIKSSKNYMDNIMRSMIDALIVVDHDARIKMLNQAALKMLGYGEEELAGKPIGTIIEEEKEKEEEETTPFKGTKFKRLLRRGFVTNQEMTWKSKAGASIPVGFSGSVMKDGNGKLVGIVVIARDMREKKAAEGALEKSRKQYVDLIDSINDCVWEVDAKGRYTFVSPRIKDILGYAPENIVGKTPFDLMPAKEARRVSEIFKQLSAERKPIRALENINRHKDGHQVFVETSGLPFYDDEGNFKGYRGTDRDVTDRKKAATLLDFYKEYAENIVGHLPVSLIVVNRDLCINFANQHFFSKMHMTKENVAEKELAKVLGNSVVKNSALNEKIMLVIKGEEARIEGRFILKSKTYDYMIVPIKEQTGRRLNALLVMEDVTKNVMMEEHLIHSEKLSAVGTFTASVVHEINNPLSIVVGNIQYLLANLHHMNLTKQKEVGEIVEALKTANSEAKRCSEIVTNLLHFSHKGASAKTKVSVNGVITGTMRLLAHQLELSKVKTYIKLADGLPRVMCDADHLQQAFVNLILNAQQVMKEGGKLYVTTSLSDNDVTISFRDTGPGIQKKYIRKIFEPFYSTQEAGKGTGLGLFIIHSIMEEHGGKIEVQSKRGQGATFILKLPVGQKNS